MILLAAKLSLRSCTTYLSSLRIYTLNVGTNDLLQPMHGGEKFLSLITQPPFGSRTTLRRLSATHLNNREIRKIKTVPNVFTRFNLHKDCKS